MSVLDRLQRLTGEDPRKGKEKEAPQEPAAGKDEARAEEIKRLRAQIDAILARRSGWSGPSATAAPPGEAVPLEDLVAGSERQNEGGRFFCAQGVAAGSCRHGRFSIRDLNPLEMERIALLANDPLMASLDYDQALFLDTETTGLAGGTGTVPFLVGLGWFEGDTFVTRQLFARDYAEERAVLVELTDLLEGRGFLVSFNGKAFDANLLAARFVMNRLPDPLSCLPHLDLLPPARRLLGHRLPDRRLAALEAQVLGLEREGDLPGSEIPQRYFDWLRRRDGRLMADVFLHNRLDVISLAALAAYLTELVDPRGEQDAHPGDRLAAARLFLARRRPGEAVRLLDPLTGCALPETARQAARELSLHHKRDGCWAEAVALWEEMLRRDGGDLFALVELAKWCEHRERDFGRALALTEQALACPFLSPPEREDLRRRRERLARKLAGRKGVEETAAGEGDLG